MENISFSLQETFREVVSRMQTEGAYDRDAYYNLIDEVLEEKIANAELDPDANTKEYSESLQMMWPQAEALITKSETGQEMIGDEGEDRLPDSNEEEDA